MSFVWAALGVILTAVAVYYWYKWYKSVKGEAADWSMAPSGKPGGESLEAFIAAHRRGEGGASSAPAPVTPVAPAATAVRPAAMPAPTPVVRPVAATPPAAPVARDSFLSGAPKLGYLLCRSALRDHHVFVHVPLRNLSGSALDPQVAATTVDLLVCNASLRAVAAIDVAGPDAGTPDPAKLQILRELGIRYLRFSAKSLPRPEQLRDLLYRM